MLAISQLTDLVAGRLSDQEAYNCLSQMVRQTLDAAFIDEAVRSIKQANVSALHDLFDEQSDSIDCCGTGGSGISHFNTSTSVAFILAAGGLKVTKFGNRAATGISGSFDFLDCLGFPRALQPEIVLAILQETNLAFLFAPDFYPTLAKIAPVRKAFGKPTVFNLIGPLLNPCQPDFRLLGTATTIAQQAIADYIFLSSICQKALIVHADSGMDELDPGSVSRIISVDNILAHTEQFASAPVLKSLSRHFLSVRENAYIFQQIISNYSSSPEYFRTLVTLNAGAGFLAAGKTKSIEAGQKLAVNLLENKEVLAKYDQCRSAYAKYAR